MQITDLAVAAGTGPTLRKFTVTYLDLIANAALTGAVALNAKGTNPATIQPVTTGFLLAQAGKIIGIEVHTTVPFAGPAITAVTVSVGNAISATQFTAAYNCFAAAADTNVQETSMFKSGQHSANEVSAFFTALGANLSVLTAGSVDFYVYHLNVTSLLP